MDVSRQLALKALVVQNADESKPAASQETMASEFSEVNHKMREVCDMIQHSVHDSNVDGTRITLEAHFFTRADEPVYFCMLKTMLFVAHAAQKRDPAR
jgi:hypothetical protein